MSLLTDPPDNHLNGLPERRQYHRHHHGDRLYNNHYHAVHHLHRYHNHNYDRHSTGSSYYILRSCASANFASTGPGGALEYLADNSSPIVSSADSPYDCCVQCVQNANCDWGGFILSYSVSNCYLLTQTTYTSASEYQFEIEQLDGSGPLYEYVNGNCGQISSYYEL
jgi:hypothetical protein